MDCSRYTNGESLANAPIEDSSYVGVDLNVVSAEGPLMIQSQCGRNITPLRNEVESTCGDDKVVPTPAVGMVFTSYEEVDDYYWRYGRQQGFGIVRSSASFGPVKGVQGKQRRNATWTCESYGRVDRRRAVNTKSLATDSQIQDDPVFDSRKSKKCECPVMMYASRNEEGLWVIRRVVNEHKNHFPTPTKTKFIHMYRKPEMTNHVRRQLLNDYSVGIKISQIHSALVMDRNGDQDLCISERDLRNEVQKEKRLKMKDGDANAMLKYFNKMTADNQNFFHVYRLDDDGQIQDILWVDARSRVAYEEFGDVVCFDATYLTNKYELPFANFVGVNHHGQSILLGCALVSHEDAETYEWVFTSWLSCMRGKAPIGILTDQATSMRKALRIAMPQSCHRWCLWHITAKFPAKLGKCANYPDFKDELLNIIYDSLDAGEFERRWKCFMDLYELTESARDWLDGLYEERHMWVPAYLKHLFWAGMKTTQRVESINNFFDGYVDSTTRLYEFAERYCKAMEVRAHAEVSADADSARSVRQLTLGFPVERIFQQHYTNAKFMEVQRECTRCVFLHVVDKIQISDHITDHVVEDRVWIRCKVTKKDIPSTERRQFRVTFNRTSGDVQCQCKYFECHGIMCRHMIKVYDLENQTVVPEKYILRRWSKDVQRRHTRVKVAYHNPSKNEQVRTFDTLMVMFEPICTKASRYNQNIELVRETLQLLDLRLDESNEMHDKIDANGCNDTPSSVGNALTPSTTDNQKRKLVSGAENGAAPDVSVKDPPRLKRIGRPKKNRLVSAVERKQTQKAQSGRKQKTRNPDQANNKSKQRKKASLQPVPSSDQCRTPQPDHNLMFDPCVYRVDLTSDEAVDDYSKCSMLVDTTLSVGGIHMPRGGNDVGYFARTVGVAQSVGLLHTIPQWLQQSSTDVTYNGSTGIPHSGYEWV